MLKEMDDVLRARGEKEENLKQLSRDREASGIYSPRAGENEWTEDEFVVRQSREGKGGRSG